MKLVNLDSIMYGYSLLSNSKSYNNDQTRSESTPSLALRKLSVNGGAATTTTTLLLLLLLL